MKNFKPIFSRVLCALALTAALFSSGQPSRAQTAADNSESTPIAQPQQTMPPDDPEVTQRAFTGVIVKSGDKVVLMDTISKTSYQLDDQEKAREFLNKTVKVTGVLDPSTGTIRVSAIDPA
jgi:hypothetical protein